MTRRPGSALLALVLAALLGGCVLESEGLSPDGEHEAGVTAGKADGSGFSECELAAVLELVNDPTTDEDLLRAAGVHTRAARNIVAYRDEIDDDGRFGDVEELDAVSWVGPVAFQQLVAAVSHLCQTGGGIADVIFSPQPYESSHLVRVAAEIDEADESLDIAMYSFSDAAIFAAIERALARGVRVRMIFEPASTHRREPQGTMSARLEALGVDVRYINKIMHHKFVIIDGPQQAAEQAPDAMLITGSGNWSNGAGTRYDENTVFVQANAELVLRFQREFNLLWEGSRDFVWGEGRELVTTLPVSDEMIVDDPTIDAVFTSANFRLSSSARYGATFSVVRGENEVSDRLVELIWSAESSIRVASGHLRSRPVSEALLERARQDPDLDIRVYLDGQEFIAASTHASQERDLARCLTSAGDNDSARQDCVDRGFLFSYQLHSEGIPVRFKYCAYRWHYSYVAQMHHKYIIIDDRIVASGSYNLSDNAEHNTMENMVIYDAAGFPGLVRAFEDNFEAIWETARAEGRYQRLLEAVRTASSFPIVFDGMSLTWDEVTELKAAIRANCPTINSPELRNNPQAHRFCSR